MRVQLISLFALQVILQCAGECIDLDPLACEQMKNQNPLLCQDSSIATSICPNLCKTCKLTCFDCQATHTNYTNCKAVKTCQTGEKCLLLSSASDYIMQCASEQMCSILTRRELRSIQSASCCSSDRCNFPTATSPTTKMTSTMAAMTNIMSNAALTTTVKSVLPPHTPDCYRDIEIMIQDSQDHQAAGIIKQYFKDMVNAMEIGPGANKIGIALFDDNVSKKFGLRNQMNSSQMLQAIDNIHFHFDTNEIDRGDVLHFLHEKIQEHEDGDRPYYSNVVIVLVDQREHDHAAFRRLLNKNERYLFNTINHVNNNKPIAKDIIVINVGIDDSQSPFSNIATDANHVIHALDIYHLADTLPKLLELICL